MLNFCCKWYLFISSNPPILTPCPFKPLYVKLLTRYKTMLIVKKTYEH